MRAAIAASISFALIAGCGAPPPVGTFRGEHPLAVNAGTDPVVAAQLRRIVLRLAPGGAATLEDGGVAWEGDVVRSGKEIRFEVTAIQGVNIVKQDGTLPRTLAFRLLDDGSISYGDAILTRSDR